MFANEVRLQYSGHHRSNPSAEAYIDTHIRYEVDCYSGRKVAERPIRFRLWHGSHDAVYIVRADDGNLYLRRETSTARGYMATGCI